MTFDGEQHTGVLGDVHQQGSMKAWDIDYVAGKFPCQIRSNGIPATGLPGPMFWEFDPVEDEIPARRSFKVVWCCCDEEDESKNYCQSSAFPVY